LQEAVSSMWMAGDKAVWKAAPGPRKAGDHQPLVVTDASTGKELTRLAPANGWYYSNLRNETRVSRNGEFLAVCLEEDSAHPPPDYDPSVRRVAIGILGPACNNLERVVTLATHDRQFRYCEVRACVPSDDGAYVAVSGWKNSLVLVDVRARKVLWEMDPAGLGGFSEAAFSIDGKLLYAGTRVGHVDAIDLTTGTAVSQWPITGGTSRAYRTVSAVTVSPDGRFVAAGVGPTEQIHVWNAETGHRWLTLGHGEGTVLILMFSPDSKALCSFAAGRIKVWTLPEDGPISKSNLPESSAGPR